MSVDDAPFLRPSIKVALQEGGVTTLQAVARAEPFWLSRQCGISAADAAEGIAAAANWCGETTTKFFFSAETLQEKYAARPSIATFSRDLDELLVGGAPVGLVMEVYGPPGAGKTQLSMQLAVSVQLPRCFGGLAAECLYVDTEGSLVVGRLREMAAAAAAHLQLLSGLQRFVTAADDDALEASTSFTTSSILNGVHYMRAHATEDLIAVVLSLELLLQQHPNVRLVVLDSVAFPLRAMDPLLRSRLVFRVAEELQRVAEKCEVAIVVTNHLSTTPFSAGGFPCAALGDSWAHAVPLRLRIEPGPNASNVVRSATLQKSPFRGQGECLFEIVAHGVRTHRTSDGVSDGV